MKTASHSKKLDIRPEYRREDLGKGVRGKYYRAYSKGTNLVLLSPDVAAAFPTAEAVNETLRSLLKIVRSSARVTSRSTRTPAGSTQRRRRLAG
jgi:hypothetical protein